MKKILFVLGTRPEAIKLSPLILMLKKEEMAEPLVCNTNQHADMVKPIFDFFGINADFNINVINSGNPEEILPSYISEISKCIKEQKPAGVAVQGDTLSAYAGGIAAFLMSVPLIHIEAGLRSGNCFSPYPEEMIRRSLAAMASVSFAVDGYGIKHLRRERAGGEMYAVGNTVTDSFAYTLDEKYINKLTDREYVLLTLHRRENRGDIYLSQLDAIKEIALSHGELDIIFPMHPSPYVREPALSRLSGIKNVILTENLPVYDFHNLLKRARLIISDSGGIQEEASFLGVRTLVLRENTERRAELNRGKIRLCGTNPDSLRKIFEKELLKKRQTVSVKKTNVCEKIISVILSL